MKNVIVTLVGASLCSCVICCVAQDFSRLEYNGRENYKRDLNDGRWTRKGGRIGSDIVPPARIEGDGQNDLDTSKLSVEAKEFVISQLLNMFYAIPSKELFLSDGDANIRGIANDFGEHMDSYREGYYSAWYYVFKTTHDEDVCPFEMVWRGIIPEEVERFERLEETDDSSRTYTQGYLSGEMLLYFFLQKHLKTILARLFEWKIERLS